MAISFTVGYNQTFDIPVYADDGWNNSDLSKQVEGFKAYCKSRNLTIDGSVADAVTTFTSQTYQSICNTLGINIDALQAEIKYKTDNNTGLQWLFTSSGLNAYNRIFAEFLQNNDLEVGDSASQYNNTVYSGKYFTDLDGNSCLCYILNSNLSNIGGTNRYNTINPSSVLAKGTTYLNIEGSILANEYGYPNSSYNYVNRSVRLTSSVTTDVNTYFSSGSGNLAYRGYFIFYNGGYSSILPSIILYGNITKISGNNVDYNVTNGHCTIYYSVTSDTYYLCSSYYNGSNYIVYSKTSFKINNDNSENVNIYLNSNNKFINQSTNINEGDTYIINNDGQKITNVTPDPDPYNPYPNGGGTTGGSTTTGGDGGDINFPNFNFDIPSINWSLGDLSNKFPFSIPFDLVAFYTILNADPVAPSIDRDIPLGNWYTWHFEADFTQFDDYAVIIRNVEYIGFVVGLIYITIKFVKG